MKDGPGLDPLARPTMTVPDAAAWLNLSERCVYEALSPGGDLEHLALRVGRRVLVKTAALLAVLGLEQPG